MASVAPQEVSAKPILGINEAIRDAGTLKALVDPARLQIISLLHERLLKKGPDAMTGVEILNLLPKYGTYIKQPTLSHHLRILKTAGIVDDRKLGALHFYTLNHGGLAVVVGLLPVPKRK